MIVFAPKETLPEVRAAIDPDSTGKIIKLGCQVVVQEGIGEHINQSDDTYRQAGAIVTADTAATENADIILAVQPLPTEQIARLKEGSLHVSFLDPFSRKDLVKSFSEARVSAVSMEMMPRTTLAQKMDAISSQANLAGYFAVIAGATKLGKILPMMMTPAGTIAPAKVFVVGVGVAGLQAIATAKRLGARVEAFDTRPIVEEQVRSLGARFVKIDIGETGQSEQGYAKELTPEQLEKQRLGMAKVCAQSDIIITTAKLFGRPAPKIITTEMIAGMRSGSIIVDLAAETGGNVEGTVKDQEIMTNNGVRIIGHSRMENLVPAHASQVYASNLSNFIEHFWDAKQAAVSIQPDDPIMKGCLLTHRGTIFDDRFRS
jgi:NAD(P) transhydrogenase subunit alpha